MDELAWTLGAAFATLLALIAAFLFFDSPSAKPQTQSEPENNSEVSTSAQSAVKGHRQQNKNSDNNNSRGSIINNKDFKVDPVVEDASCGVKEEGSEQSAASSHKGTSNTAASPSSSLLASTLLSSEPTAQPKATQPVSIFTETAMGDDLDDLLDEALDDLDLLDEAAEDLLLEEAALDSDSDTEPDAKPKSINQTQAIQASTSALAANSYSGSYSTWQDTLQILAPAERVEWAKTISKDSGAQDNMDPQPNYSSAYKSGAGKTSGSGNGDNAGSENAVASLMQGNVVLTPDDPATLFSACLKKALLAVNKEYVGSYTPSDEVLRLFKKQLENDVRARVESNSVEKENILEDEDRFKELSRLLKSSS